MQPRVPPPDRQAYLEQLRRLAGLRGDPPDYAILSAVCRVAWEPEAGARYRDQRRFYLASRETVELNPPTR